MATFADGDRVTLQRDRRPSGRVVGNEYDGKCYVRLDNGTAASFAVVELAPEVTEDKAWPPSTIETK
jgi:hypothetical protein